MLSLEATKVLSLSVLGAASLLLGLLPLCFSGTKTRTSAGAGSGSRGAAGSASCQRHAAGAGPVMAALLAFGAGALLATSLVHMLPEAVQELPHGAPIALLAGFLALYLVDELVQKMLGHSPAAAHAHQDLPHPECPVDEPCPSGSGARGQIVYRKSGDYGSVADAPPTVNKMKRPSLGVEAVSLLPDGADLEHGKRRGGGGSAAGAGAAQASCWGLLLALCIHSVIEGLAVGLEDTPQQVLFLLGAVSSHKLVVSFCLGAELVGGAVGLVPHVVAVSVFAVGSSAGVGLGMALFGLSGAGAALGVESSPVLPALQALAGGTLLYVTLAEVLPRERERAKNSFQRRLLQFASFTTGVVVISAFVYTLDVHHGPLETPLETPIMESPVPLGPG